jgi:predicted Ser/Thr protein kinase
MIGRTISHYRITEKLGAGGMGVVYKAEDTKLKRPVALKFLAAHLVGDSDIRARFTREAEAAASLNHPNICHVYEIAEVEGKTFIAMAFIEGEPLEKKIEAGPLKLTDVLNIAMQTARGLQAAHDKGVVHRDIKPANLIIGKDGHVTITDFGLALLTDRSKLTRTDETMGTVTYMSPEQTYGAKLDHRTDIWSLGVGIYEMVIGQPPFKGHYDRAVIYSITSEAPEPMTGLRTGVPMELEWIADKCLAKQAAERYQSAAELLIDLATLAKKPQSGESTVLGVTAAPGVTAVRPRDTLLGARQGPLSVRAAGPGSGDGAIQRSSLRGLRTVQVIVERAATDAAGGLPTSTLRTEVELKLRLAGIEVKAGRASYLHICVQSLQIRTSDHCVYSVKVELNQAASLTRDSTIFLPMRTWHAELIGVVDAKGLNEATRDAVSNLMDQFVNAYLSVNPK